jgi:hypothetical protein
LIGVSWAAGADAVEPPAGTTLVAPDAVVTTRVALPLCDVLTATTGVGCLLSAPMYMTENGSHAATIAATPRPSTRRYSEGRAAVARAGGLGALWGFVGVCSVIVEVIVGVGGCLLRR